MNQARIFCRFGRRPLKPQKYSRHFNALKCCKSPNNYAKFLNFSWEACPDNLETGVIMELLTFFRIEICLQKPFSDLRKQAGISVLYRQVNTESPLL